MKKNKSPFERKQKNTVVLYENCSCCCCSTVGSSFLTALYLDLKIYKIKKERSEREFIPVTALLVFLSFLVLFLFKIGIGFFDLGNSPFLILGIPLFIIIYSVYYVKKGYFKISFLLKIILLYVGLSVFEILIWFKVLGM